MAEVAWEHGWHPPKSLDSDENFKLEHTLFCRELRFVAIYALFLQFFFGQNSLLRNITRFLHVCTSDIKMIDIWLVLCQMVPFVEVVLLTAMEYQRKDPSEDEAAKEMIVVNAISGGQLDLEETEKEGQLCTTDKTRPWLPTLKTIGWF